MAITPAQTVFLGYVKQGDVLKFSLQASDSSDEPFDLGAVPTFETVAEGPGGAGGPIETGVAMTLFSNAAFQAGLYGGQITASVGNYPAPGAYLIHISWDIGGGSGIRAANYRFIVKDIAEQAKLDTVEKAVQGTDSGAPDPKGIARQQDVTH